MSIDDRQRERLRKTIGWARRIRTELQGLLDEHGNRVHFRPASSGFAMVGLLDEAPQLGKSGLRNPARVIRDFEDLFRSHCTEPPRRVTAEKALQSFLIRDAYLHNRRMCALNQASLGSDDPVALTFVTDEIALPVNLMDGRETKIICDILAFRTTPPDGVIPVVIELKHKPEIKRLIEQATAYAYLMDQHAVLFAELYSALLGQEIRFSSPAEQWAICPPPGGRPILLDNGAAAPSQTRFVLYQRVGRGYTFDVGNLAIQ